MAERMELLAKKWRKKIRIKTRKKEEEENREKETAFPKRRKLRQFCSKGAFFRQLKKEEERRSVPEWVENDR